MRGSYPKPGIHTGHRKQAQDAEPRPTGMRRAPFKPVTVIPRPAKRWLPVVQEWFNSIEQSPHSAQFQASDWATAVAAADAYNIALRTYRAATWSCFVRLSERLGMAIADRITVRIDGAEPEADEMAADEAVERWHTRLRAVD